MKKIFLISIATIIMAFSQAQSFEIRSVNKGSGIIGVEIRIVSGAAPATNDFVTDMVFGIKWSKNYNVDLSSAIATTYNIKKSGVKLLKDTFSYQAFYAENTPYNFPANWQTGEWNELMSISNTLTGIDTGSFLICEPGFDLTTNPNIGVNLNDFTPVINGDANGVLLPVSFIDFTLSTDNKAINLSWKTTHEINNKGFEIQRSETGTEENYKIINWVSSKGNSTINTYTYNDDSIIFNRDYFYRIKQIDNDGRFIYTPVKKGKIIVTNGFKLLPNPAKSNLQLMAPTDFETGKYQVTVTDAKGKVIIQVQEVITSGSTINMKVSNLAAGNYFLTVSKENNLIYSGGFIKL